MWRSYIRFVIRKSIQNAWLTVIARDVPDLIGKSLLAALVLGLLYWASGTEQGYKAFSSELNTALTVAKAGIIGAAIIFVGNVLFVAPYQLWKDANERANAAPARDFEDSPKIKFDTFIQELRHLATSRELWRAQVNSRNREDRKMYQELEKAVNGIRRLFPPSATFNVEDDPFIKLFSSAARFGEQTGYAQPGHTHGEKEWVEFEDQLHRITNLFESNSQRQIK